MIYKYEGHFEYNEATIKALDESIIGVYYCGQTQINNQLYPLYIGKGTSENGIKIRLLEHYHNDSWPDVTHFGFCRRETALETEEFERRES